MIWAIWGFCFGVVWCGSFRAQCLYFLFPWNALCPMLLTLLVSPSQELPMSCWKQMPLIWSSMPGASRKGFLKSLHLCPKKVVSELEGMAKATDYKQ